MTDPAGWTLQNFLPCLDAWTQLERPLDELRRHVTRWIFTRHDDPMANARRVAGFADLWEAVIPDSEHFDDNLSRCAVVCFYWVDVAGRTVRCDSFASLSLPA